MINPLTYEITEKCLTVIQKSFAMNQIEDSKLQMLLMGFAAAVISPILAVVYVTHGIFRMCSLVFPLLSIVLMFVVGLPVLTVFKWTYGIYSFIYSVLLHFYVFTRKNAKTVDLKISSSVMDEIS